MARRLQTENNIIMRGTSVIWGLFLLNLLTLLCSIPIVTIGPALTALHDALIRIIRKEDHIQEAYQEAVNNKTDLVKAVIRIQ